MSLGVLLFFAALLSLPGECRATVAYGISGQYQFDKTKSEETNSAAQEKFSVYFNLNTKTSSRLTLSGNFKFDVLLNKNTPGGSSTELQPNVDLKLSSSAMQIALGYREILRNESVLSGDTTTNLKSDSREVYVDTSVHTGRLPDVRLRYSIREEDQLSDGSPVADTKTNEFKASLNYKVGILAAVADYLKQKEDNKLDLTVSDTTQINSQLSAVKPIGSKTNLSLRENYTYSEGATDGAASSKSYTSSSEGRLNVNPFRGAALSTNYVYQVSEDIFSGTGTTTEKTWFTSANYSFPKFLKLYGSYNLKQADSTGSSADTDTAIMGANLSHTVGKVGFFARYEKRYENTSTTELTSTTDDLGVTVESITDTVTRTTRDNIDWQLSSFLTSYLNLALSESYVIDDEDGLTSTNNHYRLKASIGPIKSLALSPYIDYTIDSPADEVSTYTTEFVAPATYKVIMFRKLDFSLNENYRWSKTESGDVPTITSTNTATMRLNYSGPFRNTVLSGDATIAASSTTGSESTTTSTYNLRATWTESPHSLNLNYKYQTGSDTESSSNYSFQYGLSTRLNKLQFSLQARYEYTMTSSDPSSTAQSIYMVVNIKK